MNGVKKIAFCAGFLTCYGAAHGADFPNWKIQMDQQWLCSDMSIFSSITPSMMIYLTDIDDADNITLLSVVQFSSGWVR